MMYTQKKKLLIILLIIIFTYVTLLRHVEKTTDENYKLNLVVVHLDLKAMPPKIKYLFEILEYIKRAGANGLLIEYEAMFPYAGKLRNISSDLAYDRNELIVFLERAVAQGFKIIPLVDTLGHLEFALEEFKYLREVPDSAEFICPSRSKSKEFLKNLLEQFIEFHESIPLEYVHIGCGKDNRINQCKECKLRTLTDIEIFTDHINTMSNIIKSLNSNITILIWDDMFQNINEDKETQTKIKINHVEVVIRDFNPVVNVSLKTLMTYNTLFKNTWAGSAFKGADGTNSRVPNLECRFNNHFSWLKLIKRHKHSLKFKGIILTGSSRYRHSDPACDILPAALPSLIFNLVLINTFEMVDNKIEEMTVEEYYKEVVWKDLNLVLKCPRRNFLGFLYENMVQCLFSELHLIGNLMCQDLEDIDIANIIYFISKDYENYENSLDSVFGNHSYSLLRWCQKNFGPFFEEHNLVEELEKIYDVTRKKVIADYVTYVSKESKLRLELLFDTLKIISEKIHSE